MNTWKSYFVKCGVKNEWSAFFPPQFMIKYMKIFTYSWLQLQDKPMKKGRQTRNPWNKLGLQGVVNSTKFHTFCDCNSQTTAQKYCKIIIKNTTVWFIYSLFLKHRLLMYGFPYKWVIKQLWNSAFVLSEEFIWRSWVRVLSASSDNTVFNLRNTSDHT